MAIGTTSSDRDLMGNSGSLARSRALSGDNATNVAGKLARPSLGKWAEALHLIDSCLGVYSLLKVPLNSKARRLESADFLAQRVTTGKRAPAPTLKQALDGLTSLRNDVSHNRMREEEFERLSEKLRTLVTQIFIEFGTFEKWTLIHADRVAALGSGQHRLELRRFEGKGSAESEQLKVPNDIGVYEGRTYLRNSGAYSTQSVEYVTVSPLIHVINQQVMLWAGHDNSGKSRWVPLAGSAVAQSESWAPDRPFELTPQLAFLEKGVASEDEEGAAQHPHIPTTAADWSARAAVSDHPSPDRSPHPHGHGMGRVVDDPRG